MTNMDVLLKHGNPPKLWIATVKYQNVDGCHMFTSEQVKGLMIASRDANQAVRQIIPTIKALLKLNWGIDFEVKLGDDFGVFEKTHGKPISSGLQNTFAVICPTDKLAA